MKRLLTIIGCLALLTLTACGGGNRSKTNEMQKEDEKMTSALDFGNSADGPIFDVITTMGTIKVKLYNDTPKHRDNFVKLVGEGYYDGLLFHRVIDGFMIQTGDPNSRDASKMDEWGKGGPGYTVPAEILPQYYHKKGALAAARIGNIANPKKASSGSQFFIVQDEINCLHLDGEYTVFGETIEGLDIIDQIASVPTDNMDRPLIGVKILRIVPGEKPETKEEEHPEDEVETSEDRAGSDGEDEGVSEEGVETSEDGNGDDEKNLQEIPPQDGNGTDIAINDLE